MNIALTCATTGLVLGCIAAASLSEIAALYFGDSIIVRAFTFFVVLALSHATIVFLISKIMGERSNTINRD